MFILWVFLFASQGMALRSEDLCRFQLSPQFQRDLEDIALRYRTSVFSAYDAAVPKIEEALSQFDPPLDFISLVREAGFEYHPIPKIWRSQLVGANQAARHVFSEAPRLSTDMLLRFERGDFSAQHYVAGGYYVDSLEAMPGTRGLFPSKDVMSFPLYYMRWMLDQVRKRRIPRSDSIFPGIILAREKGSIHLVRPYLDPWPSDRDYKVVVFSAELERTDFLRALSRQIYPYGVGTISLHEPGHFSEFMEFPRIMRTLLRFADRELNSPTEASSPPTAVAGRRSYVLQEWSSLPNVEKKSQFTDLVRHIFVKSRLRDYVRLIGWLLDLKEREFRGHIENLLQRFSEDESLLLRVGGGIRDSMNMSRRFDLLRKSYIPAQLASNITPSSDKQRKAIHEWLAREMSFIPISELSIFESLQMQILQIRHLFEDVFSQGPAPHPDFYNVTRAVPGLYLPVEQERTVRMRLLVKLVAQFELALVAAVETKINPVVLLEEGLHADISPRSAVYRYYSAFAQPGSEMWKLFVEPIRARP